MMHERKTALVVDDDEGTREFVGELMRVEGWEVVTAKTGVEALDIVNEGLPDLVILDVDMPEMNGFEVFRRLRLDVLSRHVPIIMLTAINDLTGERHDAASMERRFGLNGPEAFVDKPVDPVFLQQAIMGVVG